MTYNTDLTFVENIDRAVRPFREFVEQEIKTTAHRIMQEEPCQDKQSNLAYEAADDADWMNSDEGALMVGIALDIGIMHSLDIRDSVRDLVWERILEEMAGV